ncbi:MAG: YqaJ viral recombinase family protein [Porphyromonadaceae bacterium]|nr:YqaJ viral recombinase family protein [Porphyromonadaceae bacterium]
MKSDLIITRIPPHTKEWFDFRRNGIGGSEIGTVLGLNKYDTVIRLFHEKTGTIPPRMDDNNLMFFGRILEDEIAKIWTYFDGTTDGYIENYKNNRVIRTCRNVNGYIVNPKYPWLFASVDRLMNIKGGFNLLTGEPLKTEAILECKTLTYWASQIWEDGIPIYYLTQVHQYMAILETDYAEIAILKDGNKYQVEKIQRDDVLCEKIIEISKNFWYNRIVPAQEAFAKKKEAEKQGNIFEAEKHEGLIQRLEPEPDNSESYREFMEERFLKERESMEGTIELFDICKKDKVLAGVGNLIDDARNGLKNQMVKAMAEHGAEMIDFGRVGSVTWSERKGSKSRTLTNRIKEKPSEDQLLTEFNKIDLDCY